MTSLPVFKTPTPRLAVWGEPTVCFMALCRDSFVKDAAVPGSVSVFFGGSAYATAIGTARRGVATHFYGPFGSDEYSLDSLKFASENNLVVSPLASRSLRKTVVVVDTDKTRSMVSDSAGVFDLAHADNIETLPADVIHVSLSSIVKDSSGSVLSLLERSAPEVLSVDLGSTSVLSAVSGDVVSRTLSAAGRSLVFANADESAVFRTRFSSLAESVWCSVERDGSAGCHMTLGGDRFYEPSLSGVTVVDTTGAGDAFAAGFLAAWLGGAHHPNMVLAAAHAASADVISRFGTV